MLLSEPDAKTKECRAFPPQFPIVAMTMVDPGYAQAGRASGHGYASPMVKAPEIPNCAASGCMHWRWGEPLRDEEPIRERRGYCGLAGQP